MQLKKVFVLSYNQLSTDFWNLHLKLNNAQLWHYKNETEGLNKLSALAPDIILIDGYWAKQSYDKAISEIISLNLNADIFCITPDEDNKNLKSINGRFEVSRLSTDMLMRINSLIIQPTSQRTNKTA